MARIATTGVRAGRRIGRAVRCGCMAVLALSIYAAGGPVAADDFFIPIPRMGRADIAGRWVLRTPTHTYCVMDFSGSPETATGSITVTGFCPRALLGRPRWRYQDGHVVVNDHRGFLVADFIVDGRNLMAGGLAGGESVWLNR